MITKSLVIALSIIAIDAGILRPKGPSCPEGDGLYAVGCSNRYLQCVNGIEYEQTCPEGLYFDRLLSRCERRRNIDNCGSGVKFNNIRKKALVINCKDRDSGDYSLEDNICDENYYQCSNGIGYMRKCPFNQKFSSALKRCDYLENCVESLKNGKVKQMAGSAQSAPNYTLDESKITTEEVEDVPNGIDCKTLNNATISLEKCSTFFWQCAQEKLYKKECPTGLYYDSERNACDYAEHIMGCSQFSGTAAPSPPPQIDHYEQESKFDCSGKQDGFYSMGECQENFASCNGGDTRVIICADHLVYDSRINACDYPEACKSDRKHEDVPQLFNHGGISDKKEQSPVDVQFNCSGKTNGLYTKEQCYASYIQCNDNEGFILKCPANLVFNMKTKTCDHKDNCDKENKDEEISEYTTTTSITEKHADTETTTTQENESFSETTAVSVTVLTAHESTEFSCANLSDGNYAAGRCLNKFYSCWNGQLSQLECPATLVYNPYQSQCDYESNVSDCESFSHDFEATTSSPISLPVTANPTVKYQSIEPFCERLADGIYGVGCNSYFYKCSGFETTKLDCPSGLFYDVQNGKCNDSEKIKDCQETTESEADSEQTSTETTASIPLAQTTTSARRHVEFSCSGRVDGIYALPFCSQDYIQCVNGKSIVSSCATGLVYSETTGLCDYKEKTPICNQQDTISDSDCSGKKDGYFSNGCSSSYFSCIGEKIRKMTCPHNLVFSEKKGVCEYPNDTEECTSPTATPLQSPPIVPSAFCQEKKNGLFEYEKCSPHYVVCDNGIAISGTCAAPLIFNSSTELCDYKNRNEQCSSNDSDIIPPTGKPNNNY